LNGLAGVVALAPPVGGGVGALVPGGGHLGDVTDDDDEVRVRVEPLQLPDPDRGELVADVAGGVPLRLHPGVVLLRPGRVLGREVGQVVAEVEEPVVPEQLGGQLAEPLVQEQALEALLAEHDVGVGGEEAGQRRRPGPRHPEDEQGLGGASLGLPTTGLGPPSHGCH